MTEQEKYYDSKFKEHCELVECYGWLIAAAGAGLLVYGMTKLVMWIMGA